MSNPSHPARSPRALQAEQARLGRFLETINKHYRALDLAIDENFGGSLDPTDWRRAFESAEPWTPIAPWSSPAITRRFSTALSRFSVRAPAPGWSGCSLNELYVLEGRLEHASPDVDADEVREGIERLRRALPALVESAVAWLGRHGVDFESS